MKPEQFFVSQIDNVEQDWVDCMISEIDAHSRIQQIMQSAICFPLLTFDEKIEIHNRAFDVIGTIIQSQYDLLNRDQLRTDDAVKRLFNHSTIY